MTAFGALLILGGLFIILNSGNFVQVLNGKAKINFLGKGTSTAQGVGAGESSAATPTGNVQATANATGYLNNISSPTPGR